MSINARGGIGRRRAGRRGTARAGVVLLVILLFAAPTIRFPAPPAEVARALGPDGARPSRISPGATAPSATAAVAVAGNGSVGRVEYVLNLNTNTLETGNFSSLYDAANSSSVIGVGEVTFDPANGELYVATDQLGPNLSTTGTTIYIVNPGTDRIVGQLPYAATQSVTGMVYDPADSTLFLLDGLHLVAVGSDNATTVIDPWPGGPAGPDWYLDGRAVYDPVNAMIYISANTTVAQFDPSAGRFTAYLNFPAAFVPLWMSVDPATDQLFVLNGTLGISNLARDNVTVIDLADPGANQTVLPVGNDSTSLLYDPADGTTWVYNSYPGPEGTEATISVIAPNLTVVSVVPVPTIGFGQLSYDPVNGLVYLCYLVPVEVLVLNGTTGTIVGAIPLPYPVSQIAPDPIDGTLYASATYNFSLVILSTSPAPSGAGTPPGSGGPPVGGGVPPPASAGPTSTRSPSLAGAEAILTVGAAVGVLSALAVWAVRRYRP